MSDVGEIRAHLVAESSEWVQGMRQANASTQAFEQQAGESLANVAKNVERMSRTDRLQAWGGSLSSLASTVTGFTRELAASAAAADDLEDGLRGAFGDRAGEMSATVQKLGTELGIFSDQVVAGAAKQLEKFGVAGEENVKRVVDIAAKTGQSVEGVAVSLGKFEKFGDSKSILSLQKQLGITGAEMEQFGAKVDASGKVLADTGPRVDAARNAMQQLIDTKFGGAAEAMADDSARLAGEMEMLKREVGASAHAFKEGLAPAARQVVGFFRELSPEVKGAVGLVADFVGTGASMGATALQAGANVAILATNTTAMAGASRVATLAVAGLTSGLGIALGVVGLLAAGFAAYIASMNAATAAAEQLLGAEEKRARAAKQGKDRGDFNKSAKDLKKSGVSADTFAKEVAGLEDQFRAAQEAGDAKTTERFRVRLAEAKSKLAELRKLEAEGSKAKPPDDVSAKEQKAADKAADKARKAKASADKKAATEAAKAHQEELKSEISAVKQGLATRELSKEQAIEQLKKIRDQHAQTAAERRQLDEQIAALTGSAEKERETATKKAEAEREKATKKSEAERTKAQKKEERERAADAKKAQQEATKAHQDALKQQAQATKQAHQQEAQEAKQAAKAAATGAPLAKAAVALSPFSGGPIQGSIEERRASAAEEEKRKRELGIASNLAESGRLASVGGARQGAAGKYRYEGPALGASQRITAGVGRTVKALQAQSWIDAGRGGKPMAAAAHDGWLDRMTSAKPISATVAHTDSAKTPASTAAAAGATMGKEIAEGLSDQLSDLTMKVVLVAPDGKEQAQTARLSKGGSAPLTFQAPLHRIS